MIPDHVYNICQSKITVSSELAKNPTQPPGEILRRLFPHSTVSGRIDDHLKPKPVSASEDLEKAYQCGDWGKTRPSDLFLKVTTKSHTTTTMALSGMARYTMMYYAP
jgi:hypothetical protein